MDRFASIFANTGIVKRYGVKPFEWYLTQHGWPERTAAYLEGAERLFIEAATKALRDAGLDAAEIDTVVTVSSTGIATPSLEARVARRLGFRSDVSRVPVFGLGCAGGVSGLSIASQLAEARPRHQRADGRGRTLLARASSRRNSPRPTSSPPACSPMARPALVLRAGDGGETQIEASGEHLWPDTLGIMGWNVDPLGFGVIFRRTIPEFVTSELKPALSQVLGRMKLGLGDIDRLNLSSRRHQGDRCDRGRDVARSGHARA